MKILILLISLCLFPRISWSNCIGDCVNGQGTYTWPDGQKYVGQFKNAKRTGQGTYTWTDGRKYVGQWKDNNRNGDGTMTYPNGNKYVGQYRGHKKNGQGTFIWRDGQKYVGQFKKDMRDGKGSHTRTDGSKYVGQFEDNSPIHGRGIDYLYDGRQMIHYGARTELRNANGELISYDLSVDDIATVRSQSANKKRRAEEQLARQTKVKERQVAEKRRQDRKKVMGFQQQLIDHSYLTGSPDGVAGKATHDALREFYEDADLTLPALDAFDTIADDLNSNFITPEGSCVIESIDASLFTACFTLDR